MNKKILITGGCGFVGRHFARHFSETYDVTIVDDMSSESALYPEQWMSSLQCSVKFIKADIIEYLKNTKESFDIVIHLAAVVGGRQNIENNPMDVAEDMNIDSFTINWCAKNNSRLIFFSSSAVYPVSYQTYDNHQKLYENLMNFNDNFGVPDLTYGWAKMTGEYLCKIAHQKLGLQCIIYRPFSGYGEDQNEVYPFPAIIKRVINKENPLSIWSNSVRDFVHIDDIVQYVNATMFNFSDATALNIGTSIGTSFMELASKAATLCGYNPEIIILNDKPQGVYYRVSDSSIDYSITLTQGIEKSINYLSKGII
jgi:nucleoside-diphosphate-sugar epimerase